MQVTDRMSEFYTEGGKGQEKGSVAFSSSAARLQSRSEKPNDWRRFFSFFPLIRPNPRLLTIELSVWIRNTIFQLLVFYACFLKLLNVTYLFLICYETFFKKRTFGLLFFAVVRFSPPSQETEAVKRKAEAKNIRRIRKSRSLIFWLRPSAKPEAAPSQSVSKKTV